MRFRVGDSEQFRILDVDNSSYAMIQNRHQATHTKEPLLIIAIKIQQHLDTMPSLNHYSLPASDIRYITYIKSNKIVQRIHTLSWPLWFLLFSPKFGLFLKSWHFTERSKTASVTLNLQWNAKTISPLKLFFLHLKTCFSELENKTYFWKKWKWSAEFDFWRGERMLKSKWVNVDQNYLEKKKWTKRATYIYLVKCCRWRQFSFP